MTIFNDGVSEATSASDVIGGQKPNEVSVVEFTQPTAGGLVNGSLASSMSGWAMAQYPAGSFAADDTAFYDPSMQALKIQKRPGANTQTYVYQQLVLMPNTYYSFSAEILSTLSGAACIDVSCGGVWYTMYTTAGPSWKRSQTTFLTPASGITSLRLGVYSPNRSIDAWFRNTQLMLAPCEVLGAVGPTAASVSETLSANLFANPDMATTASWIGANGSTISAATSPVPTVVPDLPPGIVGYLKVVLAQGQTFGMPWQVFSNLVPGVQYTFKAWVFVPSFMDGTHAIYVTRTDNWTTVVSQNVTERGQWAQKTVTFVAQAGVTYAIGAGVLSGTGGTTYAYVAGYLLTSGASDYFSSTGSLWPVEILEPVMGAELNPNTSFNTDISGWTTGPSTTAVWNAGAAQVTFGGTLSMSSVNWFRLTASLLARGNKYRIWFDAKYISGGDLQAGIAYDKALQITGASNGGIFKTYSFDAVCDPNFLTGPYSSPTFGGGAAGAVWQLENISIRQIGIQEINSANALFQASTYQSLGFARTTDAYDMNATLIPPGSPRYMMGKYKQALMLEQGTVNLLSAVQSSAETSLAGIVGNYGTATRSTDRSLFGAYSIKVVCTAAGTLSAGLYSNPTQAVTGGQIYTASAYHQGINGRNVKVGIAWYDSTPAYISTSFSAASPVSDTVWNRAVVTATAPANAAFGRLVLYYSEATANGDVMWADGLMLEQQPWASSFCVGTRAVETVVKSTPAGVLDPQDSTIEFWWNSAVPASAITSQATAPILIQIGNYYNNGSITLWNFCGDLRLYVRGSSSAGWSLAGEVAKGSTNWYKPGEWHHFALSWDQGRYFKVYIDGVLKYTSPAISDPLTAISGSFFALGGTYGGSNVFSSAYSDLRISNIQRSDAAIAATAASANPTPWDLNTTFLLPMDTPDAFSSDAVSAGRLTSASLSETKELVTDGSFANGQGIWNISAGVTIGGGAARLVSAAGEYQNLAQGGLIVAGTTYTMQATVTFNSLSGGMSFEVGGTEKQFPASQVGTPQVLSWTMIAGANSPFNIKRGYITFCDFSLTGISCVAVTGDKSTCSNAAAVALTETSAGADSVNAIAVWYAALSELVNSGDAPAGALILGAAVLEAAALMEGLQVQANLVAAIVEIGFLIDVCRLPFLITRPFKVLPKTKRFKVTAQDPAFKVTAQDYSFNVTSTQEVQ